MSGYPRQEVVRRGLIPAGAPFIQKPFRAGVLAARLRSALDGRAAKPV
jgi:hypothetical protein